MSADESDDEQSSADEPVFEYQMPPTILATASIASQKATTASDGSEFTSDQVKSKLAANDGNGDAVLEAVTGESDVDTRNTRALCRPSTAPITNKLIPAANESNARAALKAVTDENAGDIRRTQGPSRPSTAPAPKNNTTARTTEEVVDHDKNIELLRKSNFTQTQIKMMLDEYLGDSAAVLDALIAAGTSEDTQETPHSYRRGDSPERIRIRNAFRNPVRSLMEFGYDGADIDRMLEYTGGDTEATAAYMVEERVLASPPHRRTDMPRPPADPNRYPTRTTTWEVPVRNPQFIWYSQPHGTLRHPANAQQMRRVKGSISSQGASIQSPRYNTGSQHIPRQTRSLDLSRAPRENHRLVVSQYIQLPAPKECGFRPLSHQLPMTSLAVPACAPRLMQHPLPKPLPPAVNHITRYPMQLNTAFSQPTRLVRPSLSDEPLFYPMNLNKRRYNEDGLDADRPDRVKPGKRQDEEVDSGREALARDVTHRQVPVQRGPPESVAPLSDARETRFQSNGKRERGGEEGEESGFTKRRSTRRK